jgi:hypothetical protein
MASWEILPNRYSNSRFRPSRLCRGRVVATHSAQASTYLRFRFIFHLSLAYPHSFRQHGPLLSRLVTYPFEASAMYDCRLCASAPTCLMVSNSKFSCFLSSNDIRTQLCLASTPATKCVFRFSIGLQANHFSEQKLIFESSEAVSVISTFDDLGLKEDLLRGIYAYSAHSLSSRLSRSLIRGPLQTLKSPMQFSSAPFSPSRKVEMSLRKLSPVLVKRLPFLSPCYSLSTTPCARRRRSSSPPPVNLRLKSSPWFLHWVTT